MYNTAVKKAPFSVLLPYFLLAKLVRYITHLFTKGLSHTRYWNWFYAKNFAFVLQNMNTSGFRACVKELYQNRYDPVSVSYAVLTG